MAGEFEDQEQLGQEENHSSENEISITVTEVNKNDSSGNDMFSGMKASSFSQVDMDEEAKNLSSTPKQDYTGTTENQATTDNGPTNPDPGPKKNNQKSAERIVKASDRGIAFLLSWMADDEDSDIYRAKETEIKEIATELAEGFEEMGMEVKMPWWIGIAVLVLIVYGDKFKIALKRRKQNKKLKQAKEAVKAANQARQQNEGVTVVSMENAGGPVVEDAVVLEVQKFHACPQCGNMTDKPKFCSKACSAKYNASTGNVGRKSKKSA